ncbi:3'-5' exonuclease [Chitinophaga eiseniae]|uniref:3'-5' exonuclease n=1 Tax=Chitinophaga eiseniae TaxID=634771 RepID=UPI001B3B2D97|nr:3'-5' exonuclease [Chitinophaga eiseniae]
MLEDANNAKLYDQLRNKLFSEVKAIYIDKDFLIDDKKNDEDDEGKKGSKRDNLIKHLFKIQKNIFLYQDKKYNDFLRITDYRDRIQSIDDKRKLKDSIDKLVNVENRTIEDIIKEADRMGICLIDDKLLSFKEKQEYLFNRVKDIEFKEFQNLYVYLEGKTPFSTQHKTKGAEFDNVFVVLDNGGWNNYNFEHLFTGSGNLNVLGRSQKIFYVCCTRAKERLAVFYHNPSASVINKAKEWFGESKVINVTGLQL